MSHIEDMRESVVGNTRAHASEHPVVAVELTIIVVLNEEDPGATDESGRVVFAREFQRALDDGYFMDLRYDTLEFDVVKREVLHVEPASIGPGRDPDLSDYMTADEINNRE